MEPKISIYVATHVKMPHPPKKDSIYIPIAVGAALREDNWGYLRDDSEINNLSKRNLNFCELGAQYFAWKNDHDSDIKGLLHYRRWFVNNFNMPLTDDEIIDTLNKYDIITNGASDTCISKAPLRNSVYGNYKGCHHAKDLDWFDTIVKRRYPNDWPRFHEAMYYSNIECWNCMFIASKQVFDDYSAWLFPVLFEMDQELDLKEYDDYNKRIYGFMGERILFPYIYAKKLRPTTFMVNDCHNDTERCFEV